MKGKKEGKDYFNPTYVWHRMRRKKKKGRKKGNYFQPICVIFDRQAENKKERKNEERME